MVRLYYFGSGYAFCFGATRHTSIDTATYAGLHKSSDRVGSSIRIPTSVYIYLRAEFGNLNNNIIFVRPVPDIHLLPVES